MFPSKILIIQTAFLGDVILATALIEKLYHFFPKSRIARRTKRYTATLLKIISAGNSMDIFLR